MRQTLKTGQKSLFLSGFPSFAPVPTPRRPFYARPFRWTRPPYPANRSDFWSWREIGWKPCIYIRIFRRFLCNDTAYGHDRRQWRCSFVYLLDTDIWLVKTNQMVLIYRKAPALRYIFMRESEMFVLMPKAKPESVYFFAALWHEPCMAQCAQFAPQVDLPCFLHFLK